MNVSFIMLCGLPGAGKTTLAKKLESERQVVRLCPDEWIISLLKNKSDMEEADRLRTLVEKLLLDHSLLLIKKGISVILENGFWSKSERDTYRSIAERSGVKVELHYLNASFTVLWERINKRNQSGYPFNIDSYNLKKWEKSFEPPTEVEGKKFDYFKRYL